MSQYGALLNSYNLVIMPSIQVLHADVSDQERDLLVSQLAEIEAVVEYRIALVNLYLAEGSLLERRGIGLENHPADL